MLQKLKREWRELRNDRPGQRFQKRYERRHEGGPGGLRRVLFIGSGLLVVAAGIFFLPAPGPGFLILLLGAGLMAQESTTAARFLDWSEVRLRDLVGWVRGLWDRSSPPGRVLLVLLALLVTAGAAYLGYRLFFSR